MFVQFKSRVDCTKFMQIQQQQQCCWFVVVYYTYLLFFFAHCFPRTISTLCICIFRYTIIIERVNSICIQVYTYTRIIFFLLFVIFYSNFTSSVFGLLLWFNCTYIQLVNAPIYVCNDFFFYYYYYYPCSFFLLL